MKVKKVPLRKCRVTQERLPKGELLRIVRTNEGEVKYDPTGKANGRGVYLKKDIVVIEKAQKTKALEKELETTVPEEVYLTLINLLKNEK